MIVSILCDSVLWLSNIIIKLNNTHEIFIYKKRKKVKILTINHSEEKNILLIIMEEIN